MTDHIKTETETVPEFNLLTIEEITELNPAAAEAIKEMDPVEQEGAIEYISKEYAREFEQAVEQKRQQGAEKLQNILSKQRKTELKEKFSVVTSAVSDLGRSVKGATKEGVHNVKDWAHEFKVQRRMEQIHERNVKTDEDLRAQAEREIAEEKAKEEAENGGPDVTVVA